MTRTRSTMRWLTAVVALLIAGTPLPGMDAGLPARELKAALILRLVDFVEWPSSPRRPGAPFQICVVADKPMAGVLSEGARSLRVAGAPVEVLSAPNLQDLLGCQLIVIGDFDDRKVRSFLAANASRPILTVGDSGDFLSAGGILRIRLEGGRVILELSLDAADQAGLRVSSRLLRLASLVQRQRQGERR